MQQTILCWVRSGCTDTMWGFTSGCVRSSQAGLEGSFKPDLPQTTASETKVCPQTLEVVTDYITGCKSSTCLPGRFSRGCRGAR